MRITLGYDRWYHGAEARPVVEQPGEPTPMLSDRQPPAAARVETCGTITPRQEVRQHDFQMAFQRIVLAVTQALHLLGQVSVIQRLSFLIPQQCGLLLRPGVKIGAV